MDKKEELKKELRQLEAEIRNARIKKQGVAQETKQLFNKQIKIQTEITALNRSLSDQRTIYNNAQKKIVAANKKFKDVEIQIADGHKHLDIKIMHFEKLQKEVDIRSKGVTEKLTNLLQGESNLKKKRIKFAQEYVELERKKSQLEKDFKKLQELKASLKGQIYNYQKELDVLRKQQDEVNANLDMSKNIKVTLDKKMSEADKEISLSKDKIKMLELKEEGLNNTIKENLVFKKQLDDQKKEQDIKDKALLRAYEELDKQKDEVKVMELRVRKLIRDKGVGAELKKLESSLK